MKKSFIVMGSFKFNCNEFVLQWSQICFLRNMSFGHLNFKYIFISFSKSVQYYQRQSVELSHMWCVPFLVLQVMVVQGQKEKPDGVFHHF